MQSFERWLASRPLAIACCLALIVTWLLSRYDIVGPDAMPFGDGQFYGIRALTLYGYLHSGQWARFWDLFTLPDLSSLAPPQYGLFFLLPRSMAGVTSYGLLQGATTYLLLAWGSRLLCRAMDRREWTPLLFLMLASQNVSLNYSYYYFTDVTLLAMVTFALAAQVRAWRLGTLGSSVLSGAMAASLFWIKPPNAIFFTATYFIAEIARAILTTRSSDSGTAIPSSRSLRHHLAGIVIGFVPIFALAMSCGALQSIMRLVDSNETTSLHVTDITCKGLTRLLYFPLCLSYFYHVILLAAIFAGLLGIAAMLNSDKTASPREPLRPFSFDLLLPLLIAVVALGEYYSFGVQSKSMRSLMMILPPLWLLAFRVAERLRIRPGLLAAGVGFYALCGFSQVYFNNFPCEEVEAEGYQIEGDWLIRFPPPIFRNEHATVITRFLLNDIHRIFPHGGKIAVGSDRLYITAESLSWLENSGYLLRGESSPYVFINFLRVDGFYRRPAMSGANGLLLYTHPSLQYSEQVMQATQALVSYSGNQWIKNDPIASMEPLDVKLDDQPLTLGYAVAFKTPLTNEQIAAAMTATHAPGYAAEEEQFVALHSRRLTWSDCGDILARWARKHF
jgi:hypothetical protein